MDEGRTSRAVTADALDGRGAGDGMGAALAQIAGRVWTKVALPLIAGLGVLVATGLALWLSHGAPGWAPFLAGCAAGAAAVRTWRRRPRPRVLVHWTPTSPMRQGPYEGTHRGPRLVANDAPRDATNRDYASWTAILMGVAGLLANTSLFAFGAPGLPFAGHGLSFAAFFSLLCMGLYWRP